MKIGIGVIQPVLTDRTEEVELERIVERLCLMLNPRRNVQDFPFPHGDLFAVDEELERPLQHIRDLLFSAECSLPSLTRRDAAYHDLLREREKGRV